MSKRARIVEGKGRRLSKGGMIEAAMEGFQ